jgi:hypothetical protein
MAVLRTVIQRNSLNQKARICVGNKPGTETGTTGHFLKSLQRRNWPPDGSYRSVGFESKHVAEQWIQSHTSSWADIVAFAGAARTLTNGGFGG